MMDKQSFFNLIDKYQDGTTTAAEKALVEEYYHRLEAMGKTALSPEEELTIKESMWRQIGHVLKPPMIRRIYRRIAAAAAILIIVSAGSYFLFIQKPAGQSISSTANKSIDPPPGRDAAILITADGRQIILDSTTGTIFKENGVTVINLNGKLSYQQGELTNQPVEYNTVTTARGNQYQLVLADGSKVWLNSASSLRYPTVFTGDSREVELSGEGYFEVAQNSAKPFKVVTRKQTVEVLGTHFNINSYSDEDAVRTTLLEGSVKIQSGVGSRESVVIKPGQQSILTNDQLTTSSNIDIEKIMAWKNGWFEFERTGLATIMRQISRWYDVDIVYEGKPANQQFGGRISKNLPLSKVLDALEQNGLGLQLELKEKQLIVK